MINLLTIYNNELKKYGASYDSSNVCIKHKGIQAFARGKLYVCFTVNNIKNQKQLNEINSEYGVNVHFGKRYQKLTWNIDNCNIVTKDVEPFDNKCYFSCDDLTEKELLSLFDKLLKINDIEYKGELGNYINN